MNPAVQKSHEEADAAIAFLLKRDGTVPPCCAGCYHCCRESVIASDDEVRDMLELLSPEERNWVAAQTGRWLKKFRESKVGTVPEPPAYEDAYGVPAYRSLNLWCPLLRPNGKCSVYAARPLACRAHIAYKTREGCEDDAKRKDQKFALFPGLMEQIAARRLYAMKDGEKMISDHLGILLAKELLGIDEPSAAREVCTVSGETLTIEGYGEGETA